MISAPKLFHLLIGPIHLLSPCPFLARIMLQCGLMALLNAHRRADSACTQRLITVSVFNTF